MKKYINLKSRKSFILRGLRAGANPIALDVNGITLFLATDTRLPGLTASGKQFVAKNFEQLPREVYNSLDLTGIDTYDEFVEYFTIASEAHKKIAKLIELAFVYEHYSLVESLHLNFNVENHIDDHSFDLEIAKEDIDSYIENNIPPIIADRYRDGYYSVFEPEVAPIILDGQIALAI